MSQPASPSPGSSRKKRRVRRLVFVLWVAGAAAAALELALRAADPFGVGYFWAMRKYGEILEPHPKFAYLHRPGFRGRLQGVEVSINSEGLRWPEFQVKKPRGAVRVMFLGDSVVFGWGAPLDATFPMLVQRALRRRWPQVEVIAAGACSWNTRTEVEFMKERGFRYEPDVLVLVVYDNDIDPHETGAGRAPQVAAPKPRSLARRVARALGRHSYLAATLLAIRGKFAAGQRSPALYADDSPLWRAARAALEELIALCRRKHVALAAYLEGNPRLPFTQACFKQYGRVLRQAGAPFIEARPEWFQPRYRNSWVDGHANPARHRLMADAILKMVEPLVAARMNARERHAAGRP